MASGPPDKLARPALAGLQDRLEELRQRATTRRDEAQPDGTTEDAESPPVRSPEQAIQRFASNVTVQRRLAAVERDLSRLESQGFFATYPIRPDNHYPSLLTRLPIFRPSQRRRQQALQDRDNALVFDTPFGSGRRHGPPLTVRDEDTLIALIRLRSRRLIGAPHQLPVEITDIYRQTAGRVRVHCTVCSLGDVVRQLGLSRGGRNYRLVMDSVKRLGATQLELNLKTRDRYLGEVTTGRMLPIMHVQWQTYERDGLLVVLFPPAIATWLETEYTFLDWNVRLKLPDMGKSLHRFLSGQPKRYAADVDWLCQVIGYDGPARNIRQRLKPALDQLVELGWLSAYRFTGNGRSSPLRLETQR